MEQSSLSVFLECHGFVCAVDTRAVERLVLPHEVSLVSGGDTVRVVQVGGRNYASLNLGRLLGLPPTRGASVLVRRTYKGSDLPLCFETGPCLVVRAPAPPIPLASGLLTARRRAIASVFVTPHALAAGRAPVGLTLTLDELLTAAELEAAASALRSLNNEVAVSP